MPFRLVGVLSLVLVLLGGSVEPASAQAGRWGGAALAAVGAVMLSLDPSQPVQPTRVSRDVLTDGVVRRLERDPEGWVRAVVETDPETARIFCRIEPTCVIYGAGAVTGTAVGIGMAFDEVYADGRALYSGSFRPYKERSAGMKYGGVGLVIGGAVLAALWPSDAPPRVSVRDGGFGVSKSISF